MKPDLINYLFEASMALAVLYAVYELLLKRSLHFRFSRWFILAALILASLMPWMKLPVQQTLIPAMPTFALSEATISVSPQTEVSFWQRLTAADVFTWFYAAGAVMFFVRLLLQLITLWRWKQKLISDQVFDSQVILTEGALPTFSFFNWLFWDNSQSLSEAEKQLVLAHEQTHMRQWHSADVLVLEFFKILFWFHPAIYAFQKSQRAVHEYLADQAAISQSSQEIYLRLLSHALLKKFHLQLAQSFYQSPLKNRMKMLQLSQSAKPAVWKAVASLGITGLVVLGFACTDKMNSLTLAKTGVSGRVVDVAGKPIPGAIVVVKGTTTGTTTDYDGTYKLADVPVGSVLQLQAALNAPVQEVKAAVKGDVVYSLVPPPPPALAEEPFAAVEQMPEFPGGFESMAKFLSENLKYPAKARENNEYGTVFVSFVVLKEGQIIDATIAKGVSEALNAEALRVVQAMPKWNPGKQSGKEVPVRVSLPIRFSLSNSANQENANASVASSTPTVSASNEPFVAVEQMPEFPGGVESLKKYLSQNLKYPANARKSGITGKVFTSFVVQEDGTLADFKVNKGVSEEIDAEAMRVIKSMPKWTPGYQSGKAVSVRYTLPIGFAL